MTDTGDVKSQLLTKTYGAIMPAKSTPDRVIDDAIPELEFENELFADAFGNTNKAGPPTKIRLVYTKAVLSEFEPESQLRRAFVRVLKGMYSGFNATGAIDGRRVIPFVTEKVIYDQRVAEGAKKSSLDGIFGGGDKKKDGGSLGF